MVSTSTTPKVKSSKYLTLYPIVTTETILMEMAVPAPVNARLVLSRLVTVHAERAVETEKYKQILERNATEPTAAPLAAPASLD
jgi:hypothetical protein